MARYGPPDDPNSPDNDPTAYINYGNSGYGEPPGPPPEEPVPWYRKPAALVGFGALGALLIALIVFGLASLITGGDEPSEQTTLTPLTTTSRSGDHGDDIGAPDRDGDRHTDDHRVDDDHHDHGADHDHDDRADHQCQHEREHEYRDQHRDRNGDGAATRPLSSAAQVVEAAQRLRLLRPLSGRATRTPRPAPRRCAPPPDRRAW